VATAEQERAAFIEAVLAGDEAARVVFADWLDEHDEGGTAEALRSPGYASLEAFFDGSDLRASWHVTGGGEVWLGALLCHCGAPAKTYFPGSCIPGVHAPRLWLCRGCMKRAGVTPLQRITTQEEYARVVWALAREKE
jgi:uncharacterized protein (TIGR02996 family)